MSHMPKEDKWITPQELMSLGADQLAYVRPVKLDGQDVYGVFSADGRFLGATEDAKTAYYAARKNELVPSSVH